MPRNWNQIGVVAIAIALIAMLSIASFVYLYPPRLVVIDMARAIQEPASRLSHSKLTPSRQTKIMQRYAVLLPKVIASYGASHHVTVISATVLASQSKGFDITPDIINETIARLKHEA